MLAFDDEHGLDFRAGTGDGGGVGRHGHGIVCCGDLGAVAVLCLMVISTWTNLLLFEFEMVELDIVVSVESALKLCL